MKKKIVVLTARTVFRGMEPLTAHSSDVFHGAAFVNGRWVCSGLGLLWNRKRLEGHEALTYASNEFVPTSKIRHLACAWILPTYLIERITDLDAAARPVVVAATYRLDPAAVGEWSDGKRDFALEGQRAIQRAVRPLDQPRKSEFVEVSDTKPFGRNQLWVNVKYRKAGDDDVETTQVDPEFFNRAGWFIRGSELMFDMERFKKVEDCVDPRFINISPASI